MVYNDQHLDLQTSNKLSWINSLTLQITVDVCDKNDANATSSDGHQSPSPVTKQEPAPDTVESLANENAQLRNILEQLLTRSENISLSPDQLSLLRLDSAAFASLSTTTSTTPSNPEPQHDSFLVDINNESSALDVASSDQHVQIFDPDALARAVSQLDAQTSTTPAGSRPVFSSTSGGSPDIEIPSAPQSRRVTEFPSLAVVQHHPNASSANITVAIQNTPDDSGTVWHEAAVFEVPRQEFWSILPHPNDPRSEQFYPASHTLSPDHGSGLHPAAAAAAAAAAGSPTFSQATSTPLHEQHLGEEVDDGFLLLETEPIKDHITQLLSQMLANMPQVYGVSAEEACAALQAVVDLKNIEQQQSEEAQEFVSANNCAPAYSWLNPFSWGYGNNNSASSALIASAGEGRTTNTAAKSRSVIQSSSNGYSSAMYSIVQDSIKTGRVDPTRVANKMIPVVLGKSTLGSKTLAVWNMISNIWPYASLSLTVYRNRALSRTVVTWLYHGVMWAMVFVI